MQPEPQYYPENWKPLERWLPVALCRKRFAWMWNHGGYECYRCRDSGELLYLDSMGQCWEMTEIGPLPANFAVHFERCTGRMYNNQLAEAAQPPTPGEDEEDSDQEWLSVEPPNGESLSCILEQWAAEQEIDPAKLEPLFSELNVYNTLLLAEQEGQCRTLLKTTRCWLK